MGSVPTTAPSSVRIVIAGGRLTDWEVLRQLVAVGRLQPPLALCMKPYLRSSTFRLITPVWRDFLPPTLSVIVVAAHLLARLAHWRPWWAPRLARSGHLQDSDARNNLDGWQSPILLVGAFFESAPRITPLMVSSSIVLAWYCRTSLSDWSNPDMTSSENLKLSVACRLLTRALNSSFSALVLASSPSLSTTSATCGSVSRWKTKYPSAVRRTISASIAVIQSTCCTRLSVTVSMSEPRSTVSRVT